MIEQNHPQRMAYLDSVVTLSKELEDWDLAAEKSRFIIQDYFYENQPDKGFTIIKDILSQRSKFKTKRSEAHLLLKRGGYYFLKDDFAKASEDYSQAGRLFGSTKDSIFLADATYFNAQAQSNLRNFTQAVYLYNSAYRLYEQLGDIRYKLSALTGLAILYGKNNFNEKAQEEYDKIVKMGLENNEYLSLVTAFVNKSISYGKANYLEAMKRSLDSAMIFMDSISLVPLRKRCLTYVNVGYLNYFLKKENLEKANIYFKALDIYRQEMSGQDYFNAGLFNALAFYFVRKGDYKEAERTLQHVLTKAKDKSDLMESERLLVQMYTARSDFKSAFRHQDRYLALKDSAFSSVKNNTFLYYQSLYETERRENEMYRQKIKIELLEKDKLLLLNRRKLLFGTLIGVVALAIIVSYFIWKLNKRKRKSLLFEIEENRKELLSFTKELLTKSKEQQLLQDQLKTLKGHVQKTEDLNTIQQLYESKILTSEDWAAFKKKFSSVYPEFFVKLKDNRYGLTPSEERLFALQKMNLKTREIANMLGISIKSVRTSKYRLRKKLEVPKELSVVDFIETPNN